MRLKTLENKLVKVQYRNRLNGTNIINGKLMYVSKDRIIVMVAVMNGSKKTESLEHVIKRNVIETVEPVK